MTAPVERSDAASSVAPRGAPPFVGRTSELRWLGSCLDAALAGQPRVALVVGEPGIGKTRLLRELQTQATARGVIVCVGRGYEDLAVPFLPFADALEDVIRTLPASVARAIGPDVEIARRLVRGDAATAFDRSHRPWQEPDSRLFLALSRVVIEVARTKPMLLIVDDLHWLDHGSLEQFSHLVLSVADARGRDRLHLLLVATTRPTEPTQRLARVMGRFQREDVCQRLDLGGLGETEITRLVGGLGLRRPSHQMIAVVNEATQGNPLFVQEVIEHLRRHGAIRQHGGYLTTTSAPGDVPLPLDVTTAITSRADGLEPAVRRLLTLAACVGEGIDPGLLATVGGLAPGAVLERLEAAVAQRLVSGDERRFQFAHPLIRRSFYGMQSPPQRQRTHAAVAGALRALPGEPTADRDLEIAHHLVAAGPAAERDLVVAYTRRAGHLAFARASWTEAARFYAAALAAGDAILPLRDRAELHRLAGLSHYRDQDAGPCLEQYERAIAAFREVDDPRGLARALMGKTRAHFTLASVSYGTLIDPSPLTEVAGRLADDDPALCGFVWSELAQVYWTARRPADAREVGTRALELGRTLGDDLLGAEAHRALALVSGQQLDPAAALTHLERGLDCARRGGDAWVEGQLLQRIPLALIWCGRLGDAAVVARSADELTRRLHDWGDHSLAQGAEVCRSVAVGDFDAAERHTHQAMTLVQRSGYPWAGPTALPALACARWLRGAWGEADDALAILAEPGRIFEDPGPAIHFYVFLLRQAIRAWTERPERLREEFRERLVPLARSLTAEEATDIYTSGCYGAVVDIAERVGSPEMAAAVYDRLAYAAERGVVVSTGWVCLLPRALGTASTLLRQWDRARAWFETAHAVAKAQCMRPELARTELGMARLLLARGRQADRHEATEAVRRALAILHELGMKPLLAEGRALLSVLAAPIERRRPRALPHGLTRLDETILHHLARGRDDASIARDLVLRHRTFSRRLRSLLRKIGAATREGAVAYARDRGFTPDAPPPRDRSVVTILFTDVAGSTTLLDRLGDAVARELLRTHDDVVRDALARTDGTETKHTGDGIMATFPSVALALECAISIQRRIAAHNASAPERRLGVRVGLNAGEPIAERGDLFGAAVTAAARVCGRARPGQILVSEVVQQLAAGQDVRFIDRGRTALRGFAARHRLFEVAW